jgi:hypothetical protein
VKATDAVLPVRSLAGSRVRSTLRLLLPALLVAGAGVSAGACASVPQGPPEAGEQRGGLPMLSGQDVLLLPVQRPDLPSDQVDREVAFALEARAGGVEWIGPEQMRRLMGRSVMDIPIDRLPIDMFFQAEVTRVGDPVYGMLRRVAALTDATVALIPLSLVIRPASEGVEPGLESMATLLDLRTGRVLWLGTVEALGDPDDPATLARLADALARALQPAAGGAGTPAPRLGPDNRIIPKPATR